MRLALKKFGAYILRMMTKEEFSQALRDMGYSRERFAQLVDVKSPTTVENWATGDVKVPGPIGTIVDLVKARPELRVWLEERRPPGEGAIRADKKRRIQKASRVITATADETETTQ